MIKFDPKGPPFVTGGGGRAIDMTFLRSSPAWLDGVEYGNNTPRFPSQSGTRGVLVEEAATNVFLWSDDLTNAAWAKGATASATQTGTAPDGVSPWSLLAVSAANGQATQAPSMTNGSANTISAIVKAGTLSTVALLAYDSLASRVVSFDLTTGATASVGGTLTYTAGATSLGGGVWFIWLTYTPTATVVAAGQFAGVRLLNIGNVNVWRVNHQAKAYPTQGIKTTSANVTRSAEALSASIAGLLLPAAGALVLPCYVTRLTGTGSRYLFRVPNSGGTDELYLGIVNNKWQAKVGTAAAVASSGNAAVGAAYPVLTWDASGWEVWVAGALVASGTGTTPFSAFGATAHIGSKDGTTGHFNDTIRGAYLYLDKFTGAEAAAASNGSPPSDFTAYLNFQNGTLSARTAGGNLAYGYDQFASFNTINFE